MRFLLNSHSLMRLASILSVNCYKLYMDSNSHQKFGIKSYIISYTAKCLFELKQITGSLSIQRDI